MAPRARMSLLSSSAVACAASRRSPAATVFQAPSRPARTARAKMSLGFTGSTPDVSAVAVHDLRRHLRQELALDGVGAGLQDPAGLLNVPQSDAAGTRQGAACGDRLQDGRHVGGALALTREQGGQLGMDLEGEDERQRDGAVADVGAGALAGAGLVAAAVEDVVEHLEGKTDETAVLGERGGRLLPGAGKPGAEPAGGREQVGRLAFAAKLALRLRHRHAVGVVALQDFSLRKTHGLSLIHISEPTRLGMISYAVFCL